MKHLYHLHKNTLTTFTWYNWIPVIVLGILALPVSGQQLKINSGAYLINSGAAYVIINNTDLVNDGTYVKGTETVTLSGNTARTISGSSDTNLYNLSVTNTGGISTLLSQLTVSNLIIASGSTLNINTAKAVTVTGLLTNSAGTGGLLVKASPSEANGTLIFHNAVGSPVSATVEMYSKAFKNDAAPTNKFKWQYIGIPLRALVASPTLDGGYIRRYDETGTTTSWIQLVNASTLTPYTGYEITQVAARYYVFEGQLENGDFSSSQLSYTSAALFPGQHIFSNPYTAAIDITQLTFGTQTEASVYLYNTGSLQDWTDNSGGSALGTSPGQYTVAPKLTAGSGGIPAQIPSMQGFLVKAMSNSVDATFSIPYSSVVVKDTALQRAPSAHKALVSDKIFTIIDVKGSRFSDRMWVFTEPTCTRGFDNGWDGYKFLGSSLTPQLFAMEADADFQVDAVDDINNTFLGFQAGEDTHYTLTFTHQNLEARYTELYLLDLLDNTVVDITLSGTQYPFVAQPTTSPVKRFKIVTSPITDTAEVSSQLNIFISQQTIFIHNKSNTAGNLVLYDATGRYVQNLSFGANCITAIPVNLPPGAYLVKATTETVKVSKQLILK